MDQQEYYCFQFYVPTPDAEKVKTAIFAAGAGRIGNYDNCCWEIEGMGQYRPNELANPAIGECGKVEKVREVKIETVCAANVLQDVINALIEAHPYEVPAFQYWKVNG